MDKLKRIPSKDGNRFIDVIQSEDGAYLLHQFSRRYDSEEDVSYEVRELPGPSGRYGDLGVAVAEAERIVEL